MNLFARDMDRLAESTLRLAALVEEMIHGAIRSLCDRQPEIARKVIRDDEVVDRLEVRIEADALRILALHDPVAGDLRRVAAALKINHELERVADLAVSIAQRSLALDAEAEIAPIPADLETMTGLVMTMLRGSLDALVVADPDHAREVIALDDVVDRHHARIIHELKELMRHQPEWLDSGLHLFSAAGHLERIADHATNIAEEVVYLAEGAIIRHRDAPAAMAATRPARQSSTRKRAKRAVAAASIPPD